MLMRSKSETLFNFNAIMSVAILVLILLSTKNYQIEAVIIPEIHGPQPLIKSLTLSNGQPLVRSFDSFSMNKRGWDDLNDGWGKRSDVKSNQIYTDEKNSIDDFTAPNVGDDYGALLLLLRQPNLLYKDNDKDRISDGNDMNGDTFTKNKRSFLSNFWRKRFNARYNGGGYGKREPAWNNLKGLWGKRSWSELQQPWGKRTEIPLELHINENISDDDNDDKQTEE